MSRSLSLKTKTRRYITDILLYKDEFSRGTTLLFLPTNGKNLITAITGIPVGFYLYKILSSQSSGVITPSMHMYTYYNIVLRMTNKNTIILYNFLLITFFTVKNKFFFWIKFCFNFFFAFRAHCFIFPTTFHKVKSSFYTC